MSTTANLTPCPQCHGTGKQNEQECEVCFGSGEQPTPGAINVGAPIVPQRPANPNVPKEQIEQAGHWNINDDDMEGGAA